MSTMSCKISDNLAGFLNALILLTITVRWCSSLNTIHNVCNMFVLYCTYTEFLFGIILYCVVHNLNSQPNTVHLK